MKILFWCFLLSAFTNLVSAQMVFKKPVVEVTVAPDAKEIIAEFPFKVDEKGAEIKNYDAPCTCLSARIEPLMPDHSVRLKWAPGETGKVQGKFELGNFKGTVEKAIVLNMIGQDAIQLIVRVTIPDLVSMTPVTQRWVQGEALSEKIYHLKVGGDVPINITEIKGTNPNFPYELVTKKEGWEYEIRVTPKSLSTQMLGMIRIKTDSKYKRFKKMQLFAVIQAPK